MTKQTQITTLYDIFMKNKKENTFLEPSGEEKAFVYQQALELSPLLNKKAGPIAVILEKNKNKTGSIYAVTFILIPKTLNIKIQSKGNNLFDVCINAKNKAKKTISQLMNQVESPIRALQMEHFKKFPYLQ